MASLDILISGAGIAGAVTAYWLLEADPQSRITILERSSTLRASGQSIDIRQYAVEVIKRMGLEEEIRAKHTTEAGLKFVDEEGGMIAMFGTSGNAEQQSFTSEYEILRGDLIDILFSKIKHRVDIVFDDYVTSYTTDSSHRVSVGTAHSRLLTTTFDALIACDGLSSRIRNIAFDTAENPRQHWHSFYNYAAYFTLERDDLLDGDKMAKWLNTTGGRILFVRPDRQKGQCRANFIRQLLPSDHAGNERYRQAIAAGSEGVKKLLREDFQGMGWAADEVLQGMEDSDDLYASETAQIRLPHLASGNIAFVGDSAYCPTPLTGMGTSLAIIGGYVLAGEIAKATQANHPEPPVIAQALEEYERVMLPYARQVQNIPRSVPQYLNPQSQLGVSLVRFVVRFVYWTGLANIITAISGSTALQKKSWEPPEYIWRR